MITPASFAALTSFLYPHGTDADDMYDLEWMNGYHSIAEQTAITGHVSSRFTHKPTGFEIARHGPGAAHPARPPQAAHHGGRDRGLQPAHETA